MMRRTIDGVERDNEVLHLALKAQALRAVASLAD